MARQERACRRNEKALPLITTFSCFFEQGPCLRFVQGPTMTAGPGRRGLYIGSSYYTMTVGQTLMDPNQINMKLMRQHEQENSA